MKCARGKSPNARHRWELRACADGRKKRVKYLCDIHDVDLNETVMTFLGIRDAPRKVAEYRDAMKEAAS
jgi:hypothetical protein